MWAHRLKDWNTKPMRSRRSFVSAFSFRVPSSVSPMCTEPLGHYFELGGKAPAFDDWSCTALWRGYVGTWEIVDSRLYLVDLTGTLADGSQATLATIFPDHPKRVFAHWFTGTLRIPEGKILSYVHMGYGSSYERDHLIHVTDGVVTSEEIQDNGVSSRESGSEGYSVMAMTIFGSDRDTEC